jgi:hypothetical protein
MDDGQRSAGDNNRHNPISIVVVNRLSSKYTGEKQHV